MPPGCRWSRLNLERLPFFCHKCSLLYFSHEKIISPTPTPSPTLPAPPLGLRLLLTVCALAVVAQLYVPLPILGQPARDLYVTLGVAAGVVSAFGVAYAAGFLAPLLVAAAMPRLGARRVVLIGLGTAGGGLLLCAWAAAAAHVCGLLAASVVFVAGIGISVPGLIARCTALAPAAARGLAVALYTFVLFIGASLGPWLAHSSAFAHGTLARAALLLAALLGAALLYVALPFFTRGDCR